MKLAIKIDPASDKCLLIAGGESCGERVLEIVKALDSKADRKIEYYIEKVKSRSGDFSKGLRWFLLNKLFGLRPCEISEMEGMDKKSSTVRQLSIRST